MRNEKTVSIFLSSGQKEKSERSFRRIRGAFAAGSMVALAALMTGCGDVPDAINPGHWWDSTFGDDEDQAAPPEKSAAKPATTPAKPASSGTQTAQATAETAPTLPASPAPSPESSGQQAYPKIQDVPQKPAASTLEERHKVMESLAADRANAHYTDEAARTAAGAAPADQRQHRLRRQLPAILRLVPTWRRRRQRWPRPSLQRLLCPRRLCLRPPHRPAAHRPAASIRPTCLVWTPGPPPRLLRRQPLQTYRCRHRQVEPWAPKR